MGVLFWLAVVIILVLSVVAAHYLYRVEQLKKRNIAAQQIIDDAAQEQTQRRIKSIQILAQGLLDKQLSFTEGAIRISVLLDSLEGAEHYRDSYKPFHLLAEATAHIPVLEAWKTLPIKKKLTFDNERLKLEKDHQEFIIDASLRVLKEFS